MTEKLRETIDHYNPIKKEDSEICLKREKRYVYDYCHRCGQATPHTIIVKNNCFDLPVESDPPMQVIARCNWCEKEIEVEYEVE